jgi:acylglycerol lipase
MEQETIAGLREETIAGDEGLKLFVRSWRPATAPRAVVVIVPGFNSHGGYYAWTAGQLTGMGLAVNAVDLRGRGQSDGERFYVNTIDDYVHDVEKVVALAKSREPRLPVFVLGHSAGGVASCVYALDHSGEIRGLICMSFAFQVPAPDFAIAALKGLSHLAPHAHVLKLNNADFSRDPEAVRRMNEDPLIANETQPTKTVAALAIADERLRKEFPSFKVPVLILHGTHDKATKPSGSQLFHDTAGSSDKTLKLYDGYYHDMLNDVGREKVMDDIKTWIEARIGR